MWKEEVLIGKTITEVRIKGESVWLKHADGWVEIQIRGDCCSSAFIDAVHIHGCPTLTGETEEIGLLVSPTEQEVDELTAVRYVSETRNTRLAILHRNSSNGYYSNYCCYSSNAIPPDDSEIVRGDWFRKV